MNWISVKDALPESFSRVLVCFITSSDNQHHFFSFGDRDDVGAWYVDDAMYRAYHGQVTHWCNLEVPEEEVK